MTDNGNLGGANCISSLAGPCAAGTTACQAGALVCVPGSHRSGPIPPGEPHGELPGELHLAPTAGSVVLVHSRCFHRVTANRTANQRFSVNFRARPAGAAAELGGIGVFRTGAYDFAMDRPAMAS